MSDQPATARGTRRQAAVRGAIAVLTGVACVLLLVIAIVSPSPATVVVLCACAVATGVVVAGSVPRARLVPRPHGRPRRRGPIRPSARRALAEFRRELHALPETEHPIGL
jgi:hypothetical protein